MKAISGEPMEALDCAEFETRIHEILDRRGSLDGDLDLAKHRAQCSECGRRYLEFVELTRLLGSSPLATRAQRETTCVSGNRASKHGGLADRQAWWASAAAAMLVALFVGLQFADRWMANQPSVAWSWQQASHRSASGARFNRTETWANRSHPFRGDPTYDDPQAIADQAQQWIDTLEGFPATLGELQPYCLYTASFTGVTTLTAPVSWTVDMLRRRWANPSKPESPIRSDRSEWMSRRFQHV